MRTNTHKLLLLLSLTLPLPTLAGPQTPSMNLDLQMLDRNGAPFRTFHLGLYTQGLDDHRPAAAMELPSDQLSGELTAVQQNPAPFTGYVPESDGSLPFSPDIAPLLVHRYEDSELQAGPAH